MTDYDQLARWLIACQKRPDADGRVELSPADAICLRGLGFPTVEPGGWKVPPLPPDVGWRYPALGQVVADPEPKVTADKATIAGPDQVVLAETSTPIPTDGTSPVVSRYRRIPLSVSACAPDADASPAALMRQLRAWWLRASDAQRHVLKSVLSAPDGQIRRRRLRKRQRRLRARDFNIALTALVAAKIVSVEVVGTARWIVMPAAVREALSVLGLRGGRQRPSRRAMARSRTSRGKQQPQPELRNGERRSGRPGSLLTLAPHRSGRAGSAASGSSTDGFATRRRVPAGPGSQAMATAIPKAYLASSAIRCRDVETGPNLGVLAVFPSTGATCRCPLPSTGSRGLNSPASAVL